MSEKISDIPSMKRIASARALARLVVRGAGLALPLAKLLRRDVGLRKLAAAANKIVETAPELETTPDRFNDHFADSGWIHYEMMDTNVARACVAKAERGELAAAEADLLAYYTPETIDFQLGRLRAVTAFRMRLPLAYKAAEDYRAGRYYASVLVSLSLLDGFVNDLHASRKGLFSEGVELEAWDSMSAHANGFARLARLLHTKRVKTTDAEILVPYRHGIVHGRDLGYDNKAVAAKAWHALFATQDWATKAERNALGKPPPKASRSFLEVLQEMSARQAKSDEEAKLVDAWRPRAIRLGIDCPTTGAPAEFGERTPERRVAEFAACLGANPKPNYRGLAECLVSNVGPGVTINKLAGNYRKRFSATEVHGFRISAITDNNAYISTVDVEIWGARHGRAFSGQHAIRLLCKDEAGELRPRGAPEGAWRMIHLPIEGDDEVDDDPDDDPDDG